MIMYSGCPIVWASKMQNLIALRNTKDKYIALSNALFEVIGIKKLLKKLKENGFNNHNCTVN